MNRIIYALILAAVVVICVVVGDSVTDQLGRQLMMQQLQIEEMARSDGDSGVKLIRLRHQELRNDTTKMTSQLSDNTRKYWSHTGSKSYHSTTHNRGSVFSIHDHSNHRLTVGMGEMEVILNGVQFRTRHNDYMMKQKSMTSSSFNAVEDIQFPDVPPDVLNKTTPEEQVEEMALWFKAWSDQDHSVRDYRPYFRANLCYLEGAWTHSSSSTIEESFHSDRHFLDAKTWFRMQENIRFTAYSGSKNSLENFSYLPTKIFEMINGSIALFAQWNYRILCHRLKNDLPFNRLRVVEDVTTMMARQLTKDTMKTRRAARFTLNTHDSNTFGDGIKSFGVLDRMMYEVAGKDNYQVNLTDSYGGQTYVYNDVNTKLNTGMYHRWYATKTSDAGGRSTRHRSFNDANLFYAMNTQDKVAGMNYERCTGRGTRRTCHNISQKWSYAIPLEIVYSTPLMNWNPYDIDFHNTQGVVTANGRNGRTKSNDPAKAFNGTNSRIYYRTPASLFTDTKDPNSDAADTVKGSVKVLDSSGKVRDAMASGTRIAINGIRGISQPIRQRYPIAPIYAEGNTIWKELEALKDIVFNSRRYAAMYNEKLSTECSQPNNCNEDDDDDDDDDDGTTTTTLKVPVELITAFTSPGVEGHVHMVTIGPADVKVLKHRGKVIIKTEERLGHSHELKLRLWPNGRLAIVKCDGRRMCSDGHDRFLHDVTET